MTEFGEVRTAFEYIQDIVPQNYTRDQKETKATVSTSSSSKQKVKDQTSSKEKQGPKKNASVSSCKESTAGPKKHPKPCTSALAEDDQDKKRSAEIRKQVENFRKDLNQTELHFPSSFNSHDRLLVHQVAEELGLLHESKGEGKDRCITISRPPEETRARNPIQAEEKKEETNPQRESQGEPPLDLKSLHLERMKREQQKREENAQRKAQNNIPTAPAQTSKKAKGLSQNVLTFV